MKVKGNWYPARSSACHPAKIELSAERYQLLTAEENTAAVTPDGNPQATFTVVAEDSVETLKISDRVGSMARRIHFTDGSQFETQDNDSLDLWARDNKGAASRSLLVHRLESTWKMVVLSVVVSIAVVFSSLKWGLPAAAVHIADALPISAHELIGQGTLSTMDRWILEPSSLEESEQDEIQNRFEALVASGPTEGFSFTLHFRGLHGVPNAFALPAGDIVLTDALIELSETPDEIDAILLHEIGHVIHKHGMRQVIEASTLTMIVSLAVGDIGGLGQLATGVPVFLLQSSYSRRSESEADAFAFARMLTLDKDPKHFAAIMRRLEAMAGVSAEEGTESESESDPGDAENESDWYSSHPNSEARARRAMEVSRSINQSQ